MISRWNRSLGAGTRAVLIALVAMLGLGLAACGGDNSSGGSSDTGADKVYKVYNALSYSGNAWSNSAANMIQAVAHTPPYDKQVEFHKIISGSDISKQISDLQSMIAAGADAIICYPLSALAYRWANPSEAAARLGSCRGAAQRR